LPAGKPKLLFFWAHWCGDCRAEASILARLKKEYGPKGLVRPQKYGRGGVFFSGGSGQDRDVRIKGTANRATLAVARKIVGYLLAVDRGERDFVAAACQISPFAD